MDKPQQHVRTTFVVESWSDDGVTVRVVEGAVADQLSAAPPGTSHFRSARAALAYLADRIAAAHDPRDEASPELDEAEVVRVAAPHPNRRGR